MNILVVEDTAQSLYLLEHFLKASGHTVWPACNGKEALAACTAKGVPDLIISDALMPQMDGFELCYAVRQDPVLCNTPFVLYTATYTAESDERFALSVGVDRFVIKPTEPEQLLKIVLDLCESVHRKEPRSPKQTDPRPAFFEEYARRVSLKLENKVAELAQTNTSLAASEKSVRELNEKLLSNVQQLQIEVGERKRVEELLRLAFLIGRMGSWELVTRTNQVLFSSEALDLLGLQKEGTDNLNAFLKGVGQAQRDEARSFFIQHNGDHELRLIYAHPESEQRHLMLRKREMPSENLLPVSQLGTIQDITEETLAEKKRLTLEQQLLRAQKMEALGNLAGGVAHDFNNILAAIFGHAEIVRSDLEQTTLYPDAKSSIEEIINAAERSRDTIRQILTFSRRQSIERQPVQLAQVVDEGLRLVRSVLPRRVTLRSNLSSERHVFANPTQIHQIILNLCTNAAYAMRDHNACIDVSLNSIDIAQDSPSPRPDGKTGPNIVLKVTDSGCGIPPDTLEHIFEPFYTTKPSGEGTGLGLAVVHGIVQSHDAAILVESTVGQGSTFTIYFPAIDGPNTKHRVFDEDLVLRSETRKHILIVDDEPSAAHTCMTLLTRLGYRASIATESTEARAQFLRNPSQFDAAVIDSLMPRLTGMDLAKALRAARPDFPIVMVAGFGSQPDFGKMRADQSIEVITKPFSETALNETLARLLH